MVTTKILKFIELMSSIRFILNRINPKQNGLILKGSKEN